MKKYILLGVILISVLLTAGCTITAPWSVSVHDAEFRSQLSSTYETHYPNAGYTWLVLDVSITNGRIVEQHLNPYDDNFRVIAQNGNNYAWQLHYDNIIGELSRFIPPNDTNRGELYFHVPIGFDVQSARLVFDPYNKDSITVKLASVPVN